ncbi:16S rRNA (guanine(527)-N(7))-methyltransferase RsmG [Gilvibacter sp.]|uniref:16S rRNA (guanine(527)-N(7))-methyltransferase RsmG n=1 Tax=Gilvibacter sp. TaxID=2729997 RepID=UPI0025C3C4B3|nr:16S rRNA (guanine(527)-N(7))-methyltransferase RsmG [Gilvibacter sp.]NQX78508.1 16S rRNA (guanine(527)-N(7))-methyltransferase RsmG [Gilvibacter sp.]
MTDYSLHFPALSERQLEQLNALQSLYAHWNAQINVVSRKDIDELPVRHVLHSLAIAKIHSFKPGSRILDVGTGGGFPGIPLAILFPEVEFILVDSIQKKIKVVTEVAKALALENATAKAMRAEQVEGQFDFIVSRAVTRMERFVPWVKNKVKKQSNHDLANGILYLKGGDLTEELAPYPKATIHSIAEFYDDPFFETKAVVHLPIKN